VAVDNLKRSLRDRARRAIEARGAHSGAPTLFADLNPIEKAFSKVKTFLRSAEPRTLDETSTAIWAALRPSRRGMPPAGLHESGQPASDSGAARSCHCWLPSACPIVDMPCRFAASLEQGRN